MPAVSKLTASRACYIKLGTEGEWERQALTDGKLLLGFHPARHDDALAGHTQNLRQVFLDAGKNPSKATDYARQVLTFYNADDHTIWVTFAHGLLYWCVAETGVTMLTEDPAAGPSRFRLAKEGWRSTSLGGRSLKIAELNGALTKTAGYQSSVCNFSPAMTQYLVRLLNDEQNPVVVQAKHAKETMLSSIQGMIIQLQPGDFEILADLVFHQGGWRRVGGVGGTKRMSDMEIEQPLTGETAFVQVKSQTTQNELSRYVDDFYSGDSYQHMFYVYHTAKRPLQVADKRITLIGPDKLALLVLRTGLTDWLMQKAV